MRKRYIAGGLGVGLVVVGAVAGNALRNPDGRQASGPETPSVSASPFPDLSQSSEASAAASVSATPSARVSSAAGILCTRVIGEVISGGEGGNPPAQVRFSPILQPLPNKGPSQVLVEIAPFDDTGEPAGEPKIWPGEDSAEAPFPTQSANVNMTVHHDGQEIVCPPSFAMLQPGEDSPDPTVVIGPVNPPAGASPNSSVS